VKMADNTFKLVSEIRKGDVVESIDGDGKKAKARIRCVIETNVENSFCKLSNINGLIVTPWHPIKYDNEWNFPEKISKSVYTFCPSVFSFLVD